MTDVFDYTSPFGLLGKLADFLFLEKYMRRLLEVRNSSLQAEAERGAVEKSPSCASRQNN